MGKTTSGVCPGVPLGISVWNEFHGKVPTCLPHHCAGEDGAADPPGSCAKAHGREEVIWDNQHGFTKGRSCLTNSVALMVYLHQ